MTERIYRNNDGTLYLITSFVFQLPASPEVSPKHQQQHSSNLVKRSKLGGVRQVEPSFVGDSLHKSMKLSPSHVGLESGQPQLALKSLSLNTS